MAKTGKRIMLFDLIGMPEVRNQTCQYLPDFGRNFILPR